jgi:hypothetical protein
MRKYLLPSLLILAGLCALAWAQTVTKSVQLSQDPTGLVGYDTNNGVEFPGHINSTPRGTPANVPVLSTCGTAPSFTGSDNALRLTTGSAATTCTVTFGVAFVTAPACVITPQGAAVQPTYTVSATAISMTVDVASTVYNIVCMGPG